MYKAFIILVLCVGVLSAEVRVKDIAMIQGIRDMQLVNYGLVVGLTGTGDKQRTVFTVQSITKMLQRLGIAVDADKSRVKNVAAVMVTATINPFIKKGTRFDVQVSSLGDATSLEGGVLIMTPLKGPDGQIYGVAQGPLSIGGMNTGAARGARQNYELVGSIPDGAILEKELHYELVDNNFINLALKQPDFTTMIRLKKVIDEKFDNEISFPQDAGLLKVQIPPEYFSNFNVVKMISMIENLTVIPDEVAKIVINERTGTIVSGKNVGIAMVAISHNDISMIVGGEEGGEEGPGEARTIVLPERVNVEQVAKALNAIGTTPRDLIAIFQALKRAGALKAALEVM